MQCCKTEVWAAKLFLYAHIRGPWIFIAGNLASTQRRIVSASFALEAAPLSGQPNQSSRREARLIREFASLLPHRREASPARPDSTPAPSRPLIADRAPLLPKTGPGPQAGRATPPGSPRRSGQDRPPHPAGCRRCGRRRARPTAEVRVEAPEAIPPTRPQRLPPGLP